MLNKNYSIIELKFKGGNVMQKFNTNKLYLLTVILLSFYTVTLISGCDNESNAQGNETQFTETYSGSFVSSSIVTDTNDDGSPANFGEFAGTSTFGAVTIQSLNEFEPALENADCADGLIEFTLVQGNFVKRFDNGELIFGNWDSGVSCFDTDTMTSTTTQIGNFTGGTGQFLNAIGPIQIDYNSTFLADNAEQGFSFGGSDGTGEGTVIFNN